MSVCLYYDVISLVNALAGMSCHLQTFMTLGDFKGASKLNVVLLLLMPLGGSEAQTCLYVNLPFFRNKSDQETPFRSS